MKWFNYANYSQAVLSILEDIQKVPKSKFCFGYPKTIRSILTASENSPFKEYFCDKEYYGMLNYKVPISAIEKVLEQMYEKGLVICVYTKNGKKHYEPNHMIDVIIDNDFSDIDSVFNEK